MGWSDQVADSDGGRMSSKRQGVGGRVGFQEGRGAPARGHGSGSEDATGDTEAGQLNTGKA